MKPETAAARPMPTAVKILIGALIAGMLLVLAVIIAANVHSGPEWKALSGENRDQVERAKNAAYASITRRLNDPSSMEWQGCSDPLDVEGNFECTYRAKNGFGALMLTTARFRVNGDRIEPRP